MDAVTYPTPDVIQFIQDHVVPIRLPFDAKPEMDWQENEEIGTWKT